MSIAAISSDSAAFPVCPVKSVLSVISSAISVGLDKFPANAKLEGVVVVASITVVASNVKTGKSTPSPTPVTTLLPKPSVPIATASNSSLLALTRETSNSSVPS